MAIFWGIFCGILLHAGYTFQNYGLQLTSASNSAFITGISVLIESHQKALEKNTKVIIKDVSKSVLKVIMMAKLEQILNLE